MRVLNVNSTLDLKSGGGTAERTFQMSRFISRLDARCTVLTLDMGLDTARVAALFPARLVALPCIWPRFYVPAFKWSAIRRLVSEADVVHLMGHWSLLNAMIYFVLRSKGRPYVVCPAGALPMFGRSAWLKRLYNLLVGQSIIRNASAWIAVTEGELPQFQDYGVSASQVTVIPNGVCEDDFAVTNEQSLSERYGLAEDPIILFMGRLNLIKGPDLLLDAFISVCAQLPGHQLVFAGPDGGMLSTLQASVQMHGLGERVHFLGHVEGEGKAMLYRHAALLVVSSRQEAMSIVALEAGICGTAVLLTDQCGFSDVRSVDPRLEVAANAAAIADGLVQLLTDPGVLAQIAPIWKRFVSQHYTWDVIAPNYIKLYQKILAK
ncbi:MAG: glycosyltransferase [Rhodoferax sp.]|uniref:glycosyltransferase n=1 Tax=Rhodoferax sp. TaxID=50421 RepID=UPI00181B6A61|nr:glycosyltransferase [Rhodoferax sp.]NMM13770.1 glycosyltransferase [Rhodoferax sp.]